MFKGKFSLSEKAFKFIDTALFIGILAVTVNFLAGKFLFTLVPTGSMMPTIKPGAYVMSNQEFDSIGYDDIVIFSTGIDIPEEKGLVRSLKIKASGSVYYVKRVIGLPGDRIEIVFIDPERTGELYRNGELVECPYTKDDFYREASADSWKMGKSEEEGYTSYSVTVPEGHYFVMGDNRNDSLDSRYIGCISEKKIAARYMTHITLKDLSR